MTGEEAQKIAADYRRRFGKGYPEVQLLAAAVQELEMQNAELKKKLKEETT